MSEQRALGDLTVADISHLVVEDPSRIGPDANLHDLLETMIADLRTHNVYVVDAEQRLIGCVRMERIVEQLFPLQAIVTSSFDELLSEPTRLKAKSVRELMISPPPAMTMATPLRRVATTLMRERTHELAIVDDQGRLVGEINMYEIIKASLAE
jgi:CBS-domain-containing membrane protein